MAASNDGVKHHLGAVSAVRVVAARDISSYPRVDRLGQEVVHAATEIARAVFLAGVGGVPQHTDARNRLALLRARGAFARMHGLHAGASEVGAA